MMPAPTAGSFRSVTDWAIEDDALSPPRDVRSTDVSRLRAQAGTIVAIVVAAIGIVLYTERSNAELRSDVRVILTRLDSQKENMDLKLDVMRLEMEKGELRKALLERMNPERK